MIPSFFITARVKGARPFLFKYFTPWERQWELVTIYANDEVTARKWFETNFDDDYSEYSVNTVFLA